MVPESCRSDFADAGIGMTGRQQVRPSRAAPGVAITLLLLFLLFEYLRLHEIVPILGALKVQTATSAALLLIVIAETAKGSVRLARQSWLLLAFLGLTAFTILVAYNQFRAYQFAYGLTLTLIAYFVITHFLHNERDLKRFLAVLLGIHMYLAVKGIRGYSRATFDRYGYTSTGQVGGSFLGDENDVALAMVVILPLAIYLFRQSRSLPGRILWGAGSVLILLTIIFTFSRGGFVGLTVMLLYSVATSQNKAKAVGGLVLAAAILIAVAPSQYWARMETIKDPASGTAQLRRNYWAAARRMFYDSPIWGVGGNNFGVLLPDYAIEFEPERRPNQWGRASHSMYFDLLAEFGLLGVLLIGSVLLWNFRDLRHVMRLTKQGACSTSMGQLAHSLRLSWVGFLVPAAFLSVLSYPHLYYLTALTVVARDLASADEGAITTEPVAALEKVA